MDNALNLEKLSGEELKSLLKEVKLYKQLQRQLGQRGTTLFHNIKNNTSYFKVEYFGSVGEEIAWTKAQDVFKKVFEVEPKKEEVVFEENNNLIGGMKVYKDDLVADMSYVKIERAMR